MNTADTGRAWQLARWAAASLLATSCGCVEREMRITSQPEGALVFVSDKEIGRTPVTLPFTWYGDYDIVLRLEGYKTLNTHAEVNPPWYEVPPLDLFSYMSPWTYRDHRFLDYKLEKQEPVTNTELIRRAEDMRARTLAGEEKDKK